MSALPITPVPPSVKGWCPGALRPMRTGDGLLVRLRITGGVVSTERLAAIARLARRHGNGLVDLSQRANLQIRGVTDASLPGLLDDLRTLGLVDEDPAVEAIRNVIGPPLAGLDPSAAFDGAALVRALEAGLGASEDLTGLPDKVGFLVDDGGRLPLHDVSADIRLSPADGGVLIALGGTARTAVPVAMLPFGSPLETAAETGPGNTSGPGIGAAAGAALSLTRAFLALRPGIDPPPRRMANLIAAIGAAAIARQAGLPPLADLPAGSQSAPIAPVEPTVDAIGVHAGLASPVLGVGAPFGRLTADQLDLLASLAPSGIRLTPWRAVLLPGVDANAIPALRAAGLITDPADPIRAVAACPGAPDCPSGAADTRAAAFALAPAARALAPAGTTLHVSGCTKGCARPEKTRAVLVGREGRFDLVVDGRADGEATLRGLDTRGALAALRALEGDDRTRCVASSMQETTVGDAGDTMTETHDDTAPNGYYTATKDDYIRDGAEIYRRSFAIIRREADLARFSPAEETVAVRIIHACGMVEVAGDIAFSPGAVEAAKAALRAGAPVFCDAKMVANGVTRARLPAGNDVICTLDHPEVPALAARIGNTRTAAAMDFWRERIEGSVIAIGNAPTALFRLFELLDQGWPKPAAVIGMPVGFVGAMESKEALIADGRLPYLVVRGRKGGSAMAAAAVNALASERE